LPPSLFPSAVGQTKKGKKKGKKKRERRKAVKKRKKRIQKKERPPHSPSGKRELIRLGAGVLRHSFP
jgi:hypothetical protein